MLEQCAVPTDTQFDTPPTEPKNRTRRGRLIVIAVLLLAVAVPAGFWLYNKMTVQSPLDNVLVADSRNQMVKATAHFDGWIDFDTVVFDLTDVSPSGSRMDVFRCFLQFAQAMKDREFKHVVLAARGKQKFILGGDYFHQLGEEYQSQNPVYTMRTFAPHLTAMDGSHPFSEYTGGLLGVLTKEMEQFSEFHNQWYVNDFSSVHN
jgi:hypothetical protein